MQYAHQLVEERAGRVERCRIDRLSVGRFHHLEVEAAEVVPEEFVGSFERLRDAVGLEVLVDFAQRAAQRLAEPLHGQAVVFVLRGLVVRRPAVHQAVGVPYLVAEIAALLAERFVEHHVVARRRGDEHRHAHAVGAVFGDQVERVGRVAQLLGHLAADFVADDAREIDVAERLFAAVFVARHNHARHPEEDDVRTRHQVVGGVVVADFRIVRAAYAVEDRNRPQPRREPGVQHVFVLPDVGQLQRGVAALGARFLERLFGGRGHHETAFRQVPGRDALPPPQLARDAPVLDVFHPVAVGVLVFLGYEANRVLHDGFGRGPGQLLHREEPLHREFRFDCHARALRVTHVVGVVLGFLQQAGVRQVGFDFFADVETIHADVQPHLVVDRAVVVEDVDCFEVVFLTQHVVVYVVCRSYFQGARAEFDVDVFVAYDGD